ncbi:hypothetical protein GAYE_PCTG10G0473 [Galdieria yellowstonensis]|uniref:Uncharacterized protein n=1 Tax=Galdieria yellowstonensis TaxID=3028027 RepID=A0AAV9I5N3_9RHOD|nr:hypothetical protein GAYE_PCTG10G0473 [Galdieria yellowstonensis]
MENDEKWFQERATVENFQFCYPKYLQAKTAIDKKAFHKDTWNHFSNLFSSLPRYETIRIVDVGAGIGSMFLHLLEGKIFDSCPSIEYLLIDSNAENVLFGIQWLIHEVKQRFPSYYILQDPKMEELFSTETLSTSTAGQTPGHTVHFSRGSNAEFFSDRNWMELQLSCETQHISLKFYWDDFISFSQKAFFQRYFHVVIAAAFLDLYDRSFIVETLFKLLKNFGIFYFPIIYDAEMSFSPKYPDASTETRIIQTYHAVMNGHIESNETSGQQVVDICKERVVDIHYGDAWWNVHGEDNKTKYFLLSILNFVQESTKHLLHSPEMDSYFIIRRQQLDQNVLKYSAKNVDCCGKIYFH